MKTIIKAFVLSLLTGAFYVFCISPESPFSFGFHNYVLMGILSAGAAFLSLLLFGLTIEKTILVTTAGVVLAVISPLLYNSASISGNLFVMIVSTTVIHLFFAGHASLFGALCALAIKKLSFKIKLRHSSDSVNNESYLITQS